MDRKEIPPGELKRGRCGGAGGQLCQVEGRGYCRTVTLTMTSVCEGEHGPGLGRKAISRSTNGEVPPTLVDTTRRLGYVPLSTMSGPAAITPEHPAPPPASLAADPAVDGDSDHVKRSTRDWIVDTGFFLLSIALGAGSWFLYRSQLGPTMPPPMLIVDLVLAALACGGVWLRRRWPVGYAAALVPISLLSWTSAGAQSVALFTVAVHRRFPVAAIVGVLYSVTAMLFWVFRFPKSDPLWLDFTVTLVVTLLLNVATIAWGMYVRARRQLLQSLRERAHRAEAEQQLRVDQARHLERERIAREMHDVLAHRISLLSLHAGALEFRPDAPAEEIARAAGVIRQNAHQALDDLRKVIWILRERSADGTPEPPQPTFAGLPALIEDCRLAGMRVRFDNRVSDLAAVPTDLGRDAYRIVQEGLTNARKHAPACAVGLMVDGAPGWGLTIEVRNGLLTRGASAPEIPGAGTGIVGLMERASLAGGRLEHGPTGDGDYRLWTWLPWPE